MNYKLYNKKLYQEKSRIAFHNDDIVPRLVPKQA